MKLMKLNIQLFATTLVDLNQSVGSVGGGSNRFKFYEKVTINSQDIENNTTNITITHLMTGTWGGFEGFYSPESTISTQSEDGTWTTRKTTVVDSFSTGETKTIGTWTGDVPHNSDGSLKLNFKCEFHPNTTAYYYLPADSEITSGYISLPTIPRASSVGVTDSDIGATATIIVNKTSSNFKHTLRWKCGSLNGTIATKTSNQTVAWTVPKDLYELIPNSLSTTVTVYCDTYSGDTLIGTKQTTFKANVNQNDNKPDVSATLEDTNPATFRITNDCTKLIKFFSNVETVISATAKNSATIKSYKVVCGDGKTATTQTSTINGVESGTFNIYVTDSRGLTTKIEKTLTMDPYVKLTLNAEVGRVSSTGSTAKVSVWGNFYVGPSSEKGTWATLSLMYRYREKGSSAWSGYTEIADNVYYGVSSSNWNNYYLYDFEIEGDFSYTKQYEFEFIASDELMTLTSNQTLKVGQPNHWWNKSSFTHNTDVDLIGKLNVEDIECKNIFNGMFEQGTIQSNGTLASHSSRIRSYFIKVKNDAEYNLNIVKENIKIYIFEYTKDTSFIQRIPSQWTTTIPYKFTTSSTTEYVRILLANSDDSVISPEDVSDVQLEKGLMATNYTPYKKFGYNENESMGKIVVDNIGCKNVLSSELETGAYNMSTGIKNTDSNYTRNATPDEVDPNTDYIFSNNGNGVAMNVLEYDIDNNFIQGNTISANKYFKTTSNTKYINYFRSQTNIDKLQLEKGKIITNYVPHKEFSNENVYKQINELTSKLNVITKNTGSSQSVTFNGSLTGRYIFMYMTILNGGYGVAGTFTINNGVVVTNSKFLDDSTAGAVSITASTTGFTLTFSRNYSICTVISPNIALS